MFQDVIEELIQEEIEDEMDRRRQLDAFSVSHVVTAAERSNQSHRSTTAPREHPFLTGALISAVFSAPSHSHSREEAPRE